MDEYKQQLLQSCIKHIPEVKHAKKVGDNEFAVLTVMEAALVYERNYNLSQLKRIAQHYHIKSGGNKKELSFRLFSFLRLSRSATVIQRWVRGFFVRQFVRMHGPAASGRARELCNNTTDFFTMETVESIPFLSFFSYQDVDGFVYGFHIHSLCQLVGASSSSSGGLRNPYNRTVMGVEVIVQLKQLVRLGRLVGWPVVTEAEEEEPVLTVQKSMELRSLELFQHIDRLGNYTHPQWFTSLSRTSLVRFVIELRDIWNYRAQLSSQVKRNICPPHGNPFYEFHMGDMYDNDMTLEELKHRVLTMLHRVVTAGIDADSQSLGTLYVLGALTLVNTDAAEALPWLHQSVVV